MSICKLFLITSDSTNHILKANSYLYKKYVGDVFDIKILGHTHPGIEFDNFEFISFKYPSSDIGNWTIKIYQALLEIDDDIIGFGLDDYLINSPINLEILTTLYNELKNDTSIGCAILGWTPSLCRQDNFKIIKNYNDFDLFELNQDAIYRITAQIRLWRKDYLIKFLQYHWSPWEFENNASQIAMNDGVRIIGPARKIALDWIEESALSGRCPGKINILGLPPEDVNYFINNNFFDKNNLQFGMWHPSEGPIPSYYEIGENFTVEKLKNMIPEYLYNLLHSHYNHIYVK